MAKYYCDICNRDFTRNDNLKRHKTDVHELVENAKEYTEKQGLPENLDQTPFNKQITNPIYSQSQEKSYNNNFSAYPFYNGYNYTQSFPNPNIQSHIKETKSFSVDDKIKIQKKLKIVENILKKNRPYYYVASRINMLRAQCYNEQSDEPLKRFIVKKNLGHLWPD